MLLRGAEDCCGGGGVDGCGGGEEEVEGSPVVPEEEEEGWVSEPPNGLPMPRPSSHESSEFLRPAWSVIPSTDRRGLGRLCSCAATSSSA